MTIQWLLENGLVTVEQVERGKARIKQFAEHLAQADTETVVLWLTSGRGLE